MKGIVKSINPFHNNQFCNVTPRNVSLNEKTTTTHIQTVLLTFLIKTGQSSLIRSHSCGRDRQQGDMAKFAKYSMEYVILLQLFVGGDFSFSLSISFSPPFLLFFINSSTDRRGFLNLTLSAVRITIKWISMRCSPYFFFNRAWL